MGNLMGKTRVRARIASRFGGVRGGRAMAHVAYDDLLAISGGVCSGRALRVCLDELVDLISSWF